MGAADHFSDSYATAREAFVRTLAAAGGVLAASHQHPLGGPDGEPLFADVGWIGPERARKLLILVSGTHGVEGFCGSGCQTGWLARGLFQRQAGPDTAVMLIHAINPHGFAHVRRVTEDNVDLNRNFVPHDRAYPVNQAYAELAEHINPTDWSPEAVARHDRAIADYYGGTPPELAKAIHGGQWINPAGTFYGGQAPTWSNRVFRHVLREHAEHATDIALIDYHSGSGRWGYFDLFVDDSLAGGPSRAWFPAATAIADDKARHGDQAQSNTPGNLICAVPEELPGARATLCVAELRTGPQSVLEAIRAENWLRHHGHPESAQGREIRQALKARFYPPEPEWRAMQLAQSNDAIGAALAGLDDGLPVDGSDADLG